jgi:hypothetical protein
VLPTAPAVEWAVKFTLVPVVLESVPFPVEPLKLQVTFPVPFKEAVKTSELLSDSVGAGFGEIVMVVATGVGVEALAVTLGPEPPELVAVNRYV